LWDSIANVVLPVASCVPWSLAWSEPIVILFEPELEPLADEPPDEQAASVMTAAAVALNRTKVRALMDRSLR
jgi:hypothetical protein